MSLELKVIEKNIGSLEINFLELKKELSVQLEHYRGLVFDDTQIGEAKSNRANLNKVKKAIDDRRKELKAEMLKPYEVVDLQAKELCGMIDEVNLEIDKQIKDFELKAETEKYNFILSMWEELNFELVKLDQIFNPKWLNKGAKLKDISDEMKSKIETINNSLNVISRLSSDEKEVLALKSKYLISLDIASVLAEYDREKEMKKTILKNQEESRQSVQKTQVVENVDENMVEDTNEDTNATYRVCFIIQDTEEQIRKLENYLNENIQKWEVSIK